MDVSSDGRVIAKRPVYPFAYPMAGVTKGYAVVLGGTHLSAKAAIRSRLRETTPRSVRSASVERARPGSQAQPYVVAPDGSRVAVAKSTLKARHQTTALAMSSALISAGIS